MKKLFLTIAVLMATTIAFAQSNYQDVIYLKSGNIIRGMIIEQVPNESLKIETEDGSIFVFKISEVEKMTKERIGTSAKNTDSTQPKQQQIQPEPQQNLVEAASQSKQKPQNTYGTFNPENPVPVEGKAVVYIIRSSSLGSLIKTGVDCDGQHIGATKPKQYVYTILEPGDHTFTSKTENKATLKVTLEAGKIYFIDQQIKMGVFVARVGLKMMDEREGMIELDKCDISKDNLYVLDNNIVAKSGTASNIHETAENSIEPSTGNQSSSFPVSTAADLAAINKDMSSLKGNYQLMNDITLENWTPIGTDKNPFSGTFNGNGHTITILSFKVQNSTSEAVSIGLFGKTGTGSIVENLRVSGDLTYDSEGQTLYMGAIAGENKGIIRCCVSSADINARGGRYKRSKGFEQLIIPTLSGQINVTTSYLDEASGGGIAGVNENLIENCYATGQITVSGEGFKNAGGIAGRNGLGDNNMGNIKQCYATGIIIAKEDAASRIAGGIAGTCMPGNIINCVALNQKIETIGNRKGITVAGQGVGYPANLVYGVTAMNFERGGKMTNAYFRKDMVIFMEKDDKEEKKIKSGKSAFYLNRGKEIDYSLTQEQNWWINNKSGVDFSFGSEASAPWVWNNNIKRPVLYWETDK